MKRSRTPSPPVWRGWAGPALVVLLGLGVLLAGVLAAGGWTRRQIISWDRYAFAFADIDCAPPPGLEQAEFLAEVRYLADRPPQFSLLEDDLARRLADAFACHPWVKRVERVAVQPPRRVQVRLVYRTPVLAVRSGGRLRVVDDLAVLLPGSAPTDGLPVLRGAVPPPAGSAGQPWGDAGVEQAVRTAALLRAHQDRLRLTAVEVTGDGLAWDTEGGSRVLWGHAPGEEAADEAPAATKCDRLLRFCDQHGGLDKPAGPYRYDVRPVADAVRRSKGPPP